jgi:hypothetical protein
MPVQAVGHTRALSNLHADPGRDAPRLFQFGRGVPVAVLERRGVTVSATSGGASGEDAGTAPGTGNEENSKCEDRLFVLRATPEVARAAGVAPGGSASPAATPGFTGKIENNATALDLPIAGWILGRFVALDPPQPIPDYSTSAGMRVVAWALLGTVPDTDGEKPQYLVAGTHGGEGQLCDFTSLRVYTWGGTRRRYETAYVENGLCGRMPIVVQGTPAGPEFRFKEVDEVQEQRVYLMKQTVVRRVKQDDKTPAVSGKRR